LAVFLTRPEYCCAAPTRYLAVASMMSEYDKRSVVPIADQALPQPEVMTWSPGPFGYAAVDIDKPVDPIFSKGFELPLRAASALPMSNIA
jgi:hypothetical protein